MMHFYQWGVGGPIVMMIFGALFIGVLIYMAIVYSRNSSRHYGPEPREESALEILQKRYAKGEINKDEFESMKTSLR